MKTGHTNMRCGLIGEHLGHSFSKIIHAEITDYSYDLVELTPEEVGDFVKPHRHGQLDSQVFFLSERASSIIFLSQKLL